MLPINYYFRVHPKMYIRLRHLTDDDSEQLLEVLLTWPNYMPKAHTEIKVDQQIPEQVIAIYSHQEEELARVTLTDPLNQSILTIYPS